MNFKKINEGTIYSAIWEDGPLYYDNEWIRKPNEKVVLKYILQININELLSKVWINLYN